IVTSVKSSIYRTSRAARRLRTGDLTAWTQPAVRSVTRAYRRLRCLLFTESTTSNKQTADGAPPRSSQSDNTFRRPLSPNRVRIGPYGATTILSEGGTSHRACDARLVTCARSMEAQLACISRLGTAGRVELPPRRGGALINLRA